MRRGLWSPAMVSSRPHPKSRGYPLRDEPRDLGWRTDKPVILTDATWLLRLGLPFLTAELRGSLSPAVRINKSSPHTGFVKGNAT